MPDELRSQAHSNGRRMRRLDRLLALRTFSGYADLSPDELAVIAAHTRERSLTTGTRLLQEGRHAQRLHFLLSGKVELRSGSRVLRVLEGKSLVGVPALARVPSPYDAVLTRDAVSLEADIVDVLDIYEDNFNILSTVLRGLARQTLETRRSLGADAGYRSVIAEHAPTPERPLDLVDRMWAMTRSMPLLRNRMDAIADLAQEATELRAPEGTLLWQEGDEADHFLLIVAGVIRCESRRDGVGFRFGSGDALGTLDAPARVPRWYDALVTRDIVALKVGTDQLLDVLEDHVEAAIEMIQGLAGAILELTLAGTEATAGASPSR